MKILNTYNRILRLLFLTTVLTLCVNYSFAQISPPTAPPLPSRTIEVIYPIQAIDFGTFCLIGGSGGSITVDLACHVSSTGGIMSLLDGRGARPAIYAIKLCQGRRVIITYKETKFESNGITLRLQSGPFGSLTKSEVFTTNRDCDFINQLSVGGTLIIPNDTQPGIYVGYMDIDLNLE